GYDSAGLAVVNRSGGLRVHKAKTRVAGLGSSLPARFKGGPGIGHTRWATHGEPNDINAHPHVVGPVAVVHNGIIENADELRAKLIAEGAEFVSETDSEVLAHLIARAGGYLPGDPVPGNGSAHNGSAHDASAHDASAHDASVRDGSARPNSGTGKGGTGKRGAGRRGGARRGGGAAAGDDGGGLEEAGRQAPTSGGGTEGIAVLDARYPDLIVAARNGSPVVLGIGDKEMFVASDVAALVRYTRQVVHLDDGEVATVRADGFHTSTLDARTTTHEPSLIEA